MGAGLQKVQCCNVAKVQGCKSAVVQWCKGSNARDGGIRTEGTVEKDQKE